MPLGMGLVVPARFEVSGDVTSSSGKRASMRSSTSWERA
jgi:hypothetical protein